MSMICICGVCIPYTALWPLLLLFFQQIYRYFYPVHDEKGKTGKIEKMETKGTPVVDSCCSNKSSAKNAENIDEKAKDESVNSPKSAESSLEIESENAKLGSEKETATLPLNYNKSMDWERTIAQDTTTIFRFTAKWCKPCKGLDPFYDTMSLEKNNPEVVFYNVDVDECDEIAALNGALTIPLFVSYRSGEQIGKLSGSDTKKITKFVADSIRCSKQ